MVGVCCATDRLDCPVMGFYWVCGVCLVVWCVIGGKLICDGVMVFLVVLYVKYERKGV